MNKNSYINEEHIIAFLDGELQAGAEIKAAVKTDGDLATATMEHTVLQKVIRASSHDARFQLTAEADTKAVAALREALRTSRGEVRIPGRAADAAPIQTPRLPAVKQLWFKRSAVGLALALFLGTFFFISNSKNDATTTQVAQNTQGSNVTSAPVASNVIESAPQTSSNVIASNSDVHTTVASTKQVTQKTLKSIGTANSSANANANSSELPKNIAATTTPTESAANPADVMISHRFAKMLKGTRVVEVTQQDRM